MEDDVRDNRNPTEWRIYFDPFDHDMDGNGWNVVSVQPDDAIAARFSCIYDAVDWLKQIVARLKLSSSPYEPAEDLFVQAGIAAAEALKKQKREVKNDE